MITSKRVFEFAAKLEGVVSDKYCNMSDLFTQPSCGTPGCHAGWADIALNPYNTERRSFHCGKIALAEFLGFDDPYNLKEWARLNPEIWGNSYGELMFCSGRAFGQSPSIDFPATVLVDHWRGVGERLKAFEDSQKPDLYIDGEYVGKCAEIKVENKEKTMFVAIAKEVSLIPHDDMTLRTVNNWTVPMNLVGKVPAVIADTEENALKRLKDVVWGRIIPTSGNAIRRDFKLNYSISKVENGCFFVTPGGQECPLN